MLKVIIHTNVYSDFHSSSFFKEISLMRDLIVSLGGWIVVFMTNVRGATSFAGGATATGFWGGMTVGRLFLSFLTARIGEFRSVLLYLALTIILELIFWLVPNLVVSAVSIAFVGMFMGKSMPLSAFSQSELSPSAVSQPTPPSHP